MSQKKLESFLLLQMLKMVYYSLVESIINYAIIIVWGNALKTVLTSLCIAQKYNDAQKQTTISIKFKPREISVAQKRAYSFITR